MRHILHTSTCKLRTKVLEMFKTLGNVETQELGPVLDSHR